MTQGSGGPSTAEAARQEINDLKRRLQGMDEELKRARHQAEKPYEQQGKDGQPKSQVCRPASLAAAAAALMFCSLFALTKLCRRIVEKI